MSLGEFARMPVGVKQAEPVNPLRIPSLRLFNEIRH